eukprot:Gb_26977 [translate_table: standard]
MQIFIQGPGDGIRALTKDPRQTLAQVKISILRSNPCSSFTDAMRTGMDSFYFSSGGKVISDCCSLRDIENYSMLQLRPRLLGGGGDGGATGAESRDCYLNMYAIKKPDKVDPNETRISKWSTCSLSQETLKPPCVIDRLGNIFNKESLVRALLGKSLPKEFSYIKGLKDMITVHLSPIPGFEVDDDAASETKFQCPITGLEFNGRYKFFALRGCGHVLSAKALKEVQSTSCLVCHAAFYESDKIVINGDHEEIEALRLKMEEERAQLREKKQKKAKSGQLCAGAVNVDNSVPRNGEMEQSLDKISAVRSKRKGAENGEREVGNGKDKAKATSKKFRAIDQAPTNATKEVYASIFTSSKKSTFKETFSCRALPLGVYLSSYCG